MRVSSVTVTAGRTFNHPHETYSNLRPELSFTAELDADEDHLAAARALQAQAESAIEDHKRALLASLEQIEELRNAERKVADLERRIRDAQADLARSRQYLDERAGSPPIAMSPAPAPEAPAEFDPFATDEA